MKTHKLIERLSSGKLEQNDLNKELEEFLSSGKPTPDERKQLRLELIQASLNHPELFLTIFESLQNEITLEDVLVEAIGKSALWHIAAAAALGKSDGSLMNWVWEKFQHQITLENLQTIAHEGHDRGRSVLWLLAYAAAFARNHEIFPKVWEKFQHQITLQDLRVIAQDGSNKGKSVLWLLAWAANDGRAEAFLKVWEKFHQIPQGTLEAFLKSSEKFQHQITLPDLLVKAQAGLHKGKSVLMLLAGAAACAKPEAFLKVWEKFQNQLTVQDLTATIQEGQEKGKSVLWYLAAAAIIGKPEAFLLVWEKFPHQITLQDIVVKSQEGIDKGKSVLWFLAGATSDKLEAFRKVWERFQDQITVQDILATSKDGPAKDMSALWFIARTTTSNNPEPFLALWEKFQDQITLPDLLLTAKDGPDKGKSALWHLANSAVDGTLDPFIKVWMKFQPQLTIKDFLVSAEEGLHKDLSALWVLATSQREGVSQLLFGILEEAPGRISEDTLMRTSGNFPSLSELFTRHNLTLLVQARNNFFARLEVQPFTPTAQSIGELFEDAETALAAGYINAYYDLGKYLLSKNKLEETFEAYKKVPERSCHYSSVNTAISENCFSQAFDLNVAKNGRRQYLRTALTHALITTETDRNELIQKIAATYVMKQKPVGPTRLVPNDWLDSMNDTTSPDWCFDRFDEIEAKMKIEEDLSVLREKLERADKTNALLLTANDTQTKEIALLKEKIKALEAKPSDSNTQDMAQAAPVLRFTENLSTDDDRKRTLDASAENPALPAKKLCASK